MYGGGTSREQEDVEVRDSTNSGRSDKGEALKLAGREANDGDFPTNGIA